jgi:hypothetical protein
MKPETEIKLLCGAMFCLAIELGMAAIAWLGYYAWQVIR